MTTWWQTPEWERYERLRGDEPGTRARLLAESDWMTRVVNLSLTEVELWRGVRKSYKALIHKAEREYVIDAVADGCIYSAMKIHEQEAGRLTRPMQTWTLMGDWMRHGHGLLIGAGVRRQMAITTVGDQWPRSAPLGLIDMRAYVYCTIHASAAYYFSSASLVRNLTHALLWHAMTALKARGVRGFELGWMEREGDTDKDRQISFLKSGFGGFNIPAKDAPCLANGRRTA